MATPRVQRPWAPAGSPLSTGPIAGGVGSSSSGSPVIAPRINAAPTIYPPFIGSPTTATGSESNPTWSVKIVTMAGVVSTTLANADVDDITWVLNGPDEATFHFPKGAYSASQVTTLGTSSGVKEIQVYRNGDLLFWGPIISLDAKGSDGAVNCRCAGVDWYLNRRFLDGPLTNLLSNADFETGLTSWSTVGASASGSTDSFIIGSQAVRLQSLAAGGDYYISQTVNAGPNGVGLLLTVSAWFYLEQITTEALQGRGLYVKGTYNGTFQSDNWYVIDPATPTGVWTEAVTTIWIPPSQVWSIEVRLYAPAGTVVWDDVKLVPMYSVTANTHFGTTLLPADISTIVHKMVAHLQDSTVGKSDVNIGYSGETTGTKLVQVYQYSDHVQFDQALAELTDRLDGFDYYVALTPTSRTFTSFAGKRGTDRSGSITLKFIAGDTTSNCVDYRYSQDGGQTITRQVVLGENNGPNREQGEAADTSQIPVTLQDVYQSPQGTKIASLQPIANERIARFRYVTDTIELDVKGSAGYIPTLRCGDLVTVNVQDGWTQVSGTRRIQQLKLDRKTNVLTVTVARDTL